jgi:hypothetical protein
MQMIKNNYLVSESSIANKFVLFIGIAIMMANLWSCENTGVVGEGNIEDSDSDRVVDSESDSDQDECPDDPDKTKEGECGCGIPEGECNDDSGKPIIDFVQPNSSTVSSNLAVVVEASHPDGSIAEVSLYIDDILISTKTQQPYEWNTVDSGQDDASLMKLEPGFYTLRAEATDEYGVIATVSRTVRAKADIPGYVPYHYGYNSAHVTTYRFDFEGSSVQVDESDMEDIHEQVADFYRICSDGKFEMTFSIYPETLSLPRTLEHYNDNFHDWVGDYEEKLKSIGVDPANPGPAEVIIVTAPKFRYSSAADPSLAKIYDEDYDYDAIRHELGHCFGLRHAQGLEGGNEIVGVEDYDNEHHDYGDVYDVMGEGDYDEHFNLVYKDYFGWIDAREVKHVVSTGTYRLYTHDQDKRSGNTIGLTLQSGNSKYTYWIEFRTNGPYVTKEGVQVHLAGYMSNTPDKEYYRRAYTDIISYLLDMTPNSQDNDSWHANDFTDAELLLGETFEEPDGAFTIKPVKVSKNVDDEMAWIDVQITFP